MLTEGFANFLEQMKQNDESAIVSVDALIKNAISNQASDIHLEHYEDYSRIRLRIDGILHEIAQPERELAIKIAARLKIMANLDIAERRLPQDGRFSINIDNRKQHDCRISSCPTLFGEKIVIRTLNTNQNSIEISKLGLEKIQLQQLHKTLNQAQGLIIITGPTGSGKTITLYSALRYLNSVGKNISTVEDPVEVTLNGVNQVNVNHKINLDFAKILRTFLRQDPDIIMLGEIRDRETADIAIKAAQTGHLVLATLHTNSAAAAITRLINMDIPPYLISSSLTLVIAQRLLRKLCPHCKQLRKKPAIYSAQGCSHCHDGYLARTGVFELLPINNKMSQLITQHKSTASIQQQAKIMGQITLRDAAVLKIRSGITCISEAKRCL